MSEGWASSPICVQYVSPPYMYATTKGHHLYANARFMDYIMVYILEHLPTKFVAQKTPYEMLTCIKPSISNVSVAQLSVHISVHKKRSLEFRKKVDSKPTRKKEERCILIF